MSKLEIEEKIPLWMRKHYPPRPCWYPDRWIGREVEYRDKGRLFSNGLVYRSRIISLDKPCDRGNFKIALAVPLYSSTIEVINYLKQVYPIRPRSKSRIRKKYKVACRKKNKWTVIKQEPLHILHWSGYRWKHLENYDERCRYYFERTL